MIKLLYLSLFNIFLLMHLTSTLCFEAGKSIVAQHHEVFSQDLQAFGMKACKSYATTKKIYNAVDWWSNASLLSANKVTPFLIDYFKRIVTTTQGVYRVYVFFNKVNTTLDTLNTLAYSVDGLCALSIAGFGTGSLLELSDKASPATHALCLTSAGVLATPMINILIKNCIDGQSYKSVDSVKLFMGGLLIGAALTRGSIVTAILSEEVMHIALDAGACLDTVLDNAQDRVIEKSLEISGKAIGCTQEILVRSFKAGQHLNAYLDEAQTNTITKILEISQNTIDHVVDSAIIPLIRELQNPDNQILVNILGILIKSVTP